MIHGIIKEALKNISECTFESAYYIIIEAASFCGYNVKDVNIEIYTLHL